MRPILLIGGPDRQIFVNGKTYTFEDHPQCGPVVLDLRGNPAEHQPNAKSPFWRAVDLWRAQGQRMSDDAQCVWETPPEPKLIHIIGRHYKVAAA